MGVEINFIPKEKKETSPKRVIVSVLVLCLSLSVGALFLQWTQANNTQVTADLLLEQEKALAAAKAPDNLADILNPDKQPSADEGGVTPEQEQAYVAFDRIQTESVPHVLLYNYVRDRLGGAQLRTFDFSDASSAIINADFESLDAVSSFATRLQERPSVLSVETGDATQTESGRYNASVTILLDGTYLREDLTSQ